jgi:Fe-S-cluster containining protein
MPFKPPYCKRLQAAADARRRARRRAFARQVPDNEADAVPCERLRIFLSRKEILAAIRADFHQYAPQTLLFLELFPLVFGERAVISGTSYGEHLWMAERGQKMFQISPLDLGIRLCDELEQTRPPLEVLAAVCRRVFRTVAQPGGSDRSGEPGIWLLTDMEDFSCRQCGHCCRNLDYYDQLTEADYNRWQELGRTDILKTVRRVKMANDTFAYRMWERTGSGQTVSPCPWLHKIPTQNRWDCRIHEVRPEICRQYPGSRKHAEMTGCPGFKKS